MIQKESDGLKDIEFGNTSKLVTLNNENDIYCYQFIKKDNSSIWIVWSDNGNQKLNIKFENVKNIKVTRSIPNDISDMEVDGNNYPEIFTSYTTDINDANIDIIVDNTPIYIEVTK